MVSSARLTVLGSLNMDISVTVPRLPAPGATVLGGAAAFAPGGKGANQAVAAARLGGDVLMAGCVGDDDFGRALRAALVAEGVSDAAVRTVRGVPTGLAMITVDEGGENIITVAPGANREAGPAEVSAVSEATAAGTAALVISAEVPAAAIRAALTAGSYGLRMLNLAPAPPEAAGIVAAGVDWLVVNESEATAVLGRRVAGLAGPAGADGAAADLARAGARNAVVTAGAAGAAYCRAGGRADRARVPGAAGGQRGRRRHVRRRARGGPRGGRPAARRGDRRRRGRRRGGHPARHSGGHAAPGRRPRRDRAFMAGHRRLKPGEVPRNARSVEMFIQAVTWANCLYYPVK